MPHDILMPSLSAGMEEGHLVRWLKSEGEAIRLGEAIAEIETDKALMELEAPHAGILASILVGDNSQGVAVNTLIGMIVAEGEALPPKATAVPDRPEGKVAPAATAQGARGEAVGIPIPSVSPPPSKPKASPLARRFAEMHGIDLRTIKGSGPGGRVVRLDVLAQGNTTPLDMAPRIAADRETTPIPGSPASAQMGLLNHSWLRRGAGDPIVLLHGFGSDQGGWRPFLAGASTNRPVLGLDLPAHGGSLAHGARSFDALVDLVEATLTGLGILRHDLVAHSLGAAVAIALAGRGQVDVRSLFLISPAGLGPDINGAFIEGVARARSEASLGPWLRELVTDPSALGPGLVRASAAARENDALVEAQRALASVLFPCGTQAFSVRRQLEALAIPVAVVFGLKDRIIPARHVRGLPGPVALHLFSEAGHMPHLEMKADVWRLLEHHIR